MAPLLDAGHAVVAVVHTTRDITEDIQKGVSVGRRHDELHAVLREVDDPRDVADPATEKRLRLQEEFLPAQKLESIGRLAARLAHDFHHTLHVILGYGEMLDEQFCKGDPMKGYVEQIITAARRSGRLTQPWMAFSRKQTLHLQGADLNDLLRSFAAVLRRVLGEKITLEMPLKEGLCWVLIDPVQMEHILMNLATNARDAMPCGGFFFRINTAAVDLDAVCSAPLEVPTRRYVGMTLTDTGCGMTQEVRRPDL